MIMSSEAAVLEEDDLADVDAADAPAPGGAAAGAAPPKKLTKRDAQRALSKDLRELRERRLKKLEEMKAQAEERAKATQHMTNDGAHIGNEGTHCATASRSETRSATGRGQRQ